MFQIPLKIFLIDWLAFFKDKLALVGILFTDKQSDQRQENPFSSILFVIY